MNRTDPVYTPQFLIGVLGLSLVVAGIVGFASSTNTPPPTTGQSNQTRLRVEGAGLESGSTADQLQGTQNLQGQSGSQNLQTPTASEQLQPNAKTDHFGGNSSQLMR
jgi:hypothetical protein